MRDVTAAAPPSSTRTPRTTRRTARRAARRRRGWTRVRSIASTVVLVAVSAFALVTVILPLVLGAHTYTVLTGSMRPGMPPGTLIAVRETPFDQIRVGHVVTYQLHSGEPTVVTHRVVGTSTTAAGERMLLTRGDANTADDPPVREEQMRGRVVLALPYLGYPGVLFGGQERGALIAAVGVAVVGYGVVLLGVELVRGRRRGSALALAIALSLAVAVPAIIPPPATAATHADALEPTAPGPADASADYLRISLDGRQFVPGDGLPLIDSLGLLAPGDTIATPLWIRNTGPDPAHAFLRLEVRVPDPNSGNLALADALALVVDGESVASGDEWRSAVIDPGGTARHDVGLHMDATAGNDTRRASVEVTPWVRLSDARGSAHEPETASSLPRTGGDVEPLIALGLLAAGVLGVGIALVVVGRRSRAR